MEEQRNRWKTINSKFLAIDDLLVHYQRLGEGKEKSILLIHGAGSSLFTWDDWVMELSKDFDVISFDLYGFGLTGSSALYHYNPEDYTRFVKKILEALKIKHLTLMAGNSLGGRVTWEFALKYPEMVDKLVLIDASAYPKKKENPMKAILKVPVLKEIGLYLTPRFFVSKPLKAMFHNPDLVTEAKIDLYYGMLFSEGHRQATLELANTPFLDHSALLSKLTQPTLILWGKHDVMIPVEQAYQLHKDIPGSKLRIYEAGHMPQEELPEQTLKDVKDFLK